VRDIIIEILTTKKLCSDEAKRLFLKGGYTLEEFEAMDTEPKEENWLGYVCGQDITSVTGETYCMVRVDDLYADQIAQIGQTANARYIQDAVIGEPTEVEYTVDVPVYDEMGEQIGTEPETRIKLVYPPIFEVEVDAEDVDGNPYTRMQDIGRIAR
jgi:hypothetical protein